jgi:hypothetical protein
MKAKTKFPKCKNETIVKVMEFLNSEYGFEKFKAYWEFGLNCWSFYCGDISDFLCILMVDKKNPTIIYRNYTHPDLISKNFEIDTNLPNWKELFKEKIDYEAKNAIEVNKQIMRAIHGKDYF